MDPYIRGTGCTTTGMRRTCPGNLLVWRFTGLEGGGDGWMMCKNCWFLTLEGEATSGPGAEETEVMTVGEEEEEVRNVTGEERDEKILEGGEVRALLMDRSTGSVCAWNCSGERRSSGGSGFTLLNRRGTASISG